MSPSFVLRLIACFGQATLALVSLRAPGPLALPLTLLSTDLLIWNFASFAYGTSGRLLWNVLNCCTSPFGVVFGFHFILIFVGRRRSLRRVLAAAYGVSALLSVSFLTSYLAVNWRRAPRVLALLSMPDTVWSAIFLAVVLILILSAIVLLVLHERELASAEERQRTRVLLMALPIAALLGATGLINNFIPAVPRISQLGTLVCAMLMSAVAFRLRLFGRRLGRKTAVIALSVGLLCVAAYCLVLRVCTARFALLVGGTATLTMVLAACGRRVMEKAAARQGRRTKLADAGRIWAQLAHDLKNPLAALQGAIQFLKEERRQGRSMDAHADFLDLIGDQIQRMVGIVDGYDQADQANPTRESVDLTRLLREIAAIAEHTAPKLTVRTDFVEPLPTCAGDRALLARVLQNLVRNALEAMPNGGVLILTAGPSSGDSGAGVSITITDTGEGMDARTRERAFDDFFTTKARGTGLGLAFVRRVIEGRGGRVSLRSAVGRGTTVSLQIPAS